MFLHTVVDNRALHVLPLKYINDNNIYLVGKFYEVATVLSW